MDALRGLSCPNDDCSLIDGFVQHFQRHMVIAIVDCHLTRCARSIYHPRNCQESTCIQASCSSNSMILSLNNIWFRFQNFGEEIQDDVDTVAEYCFACRAAQAKAEGRRLV